MQDPMKKLFEGTGFLFRETDKELYQEPSFIDEWTHRNLYFCFSAALLFIFLSTIGLIQVYAPHEEGQILPQINATFVYSMLLICSLGFVFLIAAATAQYNKGSRNSRKYTLLLRSYRLTGMILASFTFFSTEKGSSFFFEYILISMIAFHLFCITVCQLRWNSYVRYESVRIHLMQYEKTLTGEVRRDGLTGLLNRTALRNDFPDFLSKEICLALLDVDSFKHINDTYGHVYGDRVLSFIGRNMMTVFSLPEDRCYRYGGDEMMIISITHDTDGFRRKLEELQQLSTEGAPEIRVGMSIGYCCGFPLSEADLRSCIQIADTWLYQVKNHPDGQRIAGGRMKMNRKAAGRSAAALETLPALSSLEPRFQAHAEEERAVVFLDLCRFTELNERFGYRKGSWVLERVANQLLKRFPRENLANPDSDHFVLLSTLPETELESLLAAVQREIAKLIPSCVIQFRTGIFRCPAGDHKTGFMTAFYNAKYASRCSEAETPGWNGICLYDARMAESQKWDAFVRDHLDEALEKGLIVPFYQPFIGSLSLKTCGFEALARWNDPERGFISPSDFIPALEKQKKTYKLDLYMLKRVCEDLSRNQALVSDDLIITINLSRTDFWITDMPEEIDRILAPYGFAKDLIQFEITESALSDSVRVHDAVLEMKRKGYSIWLDDFGVGQSSLHALQEYEVRGIKLDHSFFQHFRESSRSHTIIHSIVDLCHETGCLMIAEGVEDAEQLWYAKQWGVNFIQGFYFSHPLPLKNLLESRFVKEITDNHDTAFYRPAANVNLSVPMERVFFAPDRTVIRFGKTVMERSGNHVTCLRINEGIRQLFHPYFVHPDLGEDLTDGTDLQETLLKAMKQADSKKDVIEFPIRLSDSLFHGQIAHLTEDGEKATYVMALSNYGIANPLPSGNAAD